MGQLLLQFDQEPQPATEPRPHFLPGVPTISYVDAGQVLKPAEGFISAYKFTLNPYSGCGFACEYCYARFFSPTMEHQQDWGRWVTVKQNALDLIRKAVRSRSDRTGLRAGDTIYMSSVTDPYQPLESKLKLTRTILEELMPLQPRLTIQTRSPLVTRDIDLLQRFEHVRVSMSVPTDSDAIRQRYEARAPSIPARLRALRTLRASGIPVGIAIAPMLPLQDATAFGRTLRDLGADEYVAQYMHATRGRFSAGTPSGARERFRDDGWNLIAYESARDTIASILAPRPLLEGTAGFQPPS